MTSMKRAYEVDVDEARSKRTRRSRWGIDDVEDATDDKKERTYASPKALNDIVKRLSSVVQEKRAPDKLQALAAASTRPLIFQLRAALLF